MADYYTEFSFKIDDVTQEEADWLLNEYGSGAVKGGTSEFEGEEFKGGFDMEIHQDPDTNAWFHSGDGSPNLDVMTDFIQEFLVKFRPKDEIFFEWNEENDDRSCRT